MGKRSDIRVREAVIAFRDHTYRCPIKFGGKTSTAATDHQVVVTVETRDGRVADGFGAMPLSETWAFPTDAVPVETKLDVMKELAALLPESIAEPLHPLDIAHAFEPMLFDAAGELSRERGLAAPIPKMCALVVNSALDAAINDAFGKAHGVNVFETYGPEFVTNDLSHYLDDAFAGEYPDAYVLARPLDRMPLYHLVGALDPLTGAAVATPVGDGGPETLGDWIRADGLTHLKIKLNGDDLDWDVERVLAVNRVADAVAPDRAWQFSLDFNERCANVEYLLEFVRRLEEGSPEAFDRTQYIEQPTARDLRANPENRMHAAAERKPVVIDESLVDYESLLLAQEMGYSGVALKACKGQSQSVLLGAAAQKRGLFLCVQDLTCTGAAYLHSIGLASRIPGVAAVEGNGRQYCPAANAGWEQRFPGCFEVRDGTVETGRLAGPGLGCVAPGRERETLRNG